MGLWRAGPVGGSRASDPAGSVLRPCPPPPARGPSLPGRAPLPASRSASVYSTAAAAPAQNRCATALRGRIARPWSVSALASQRCAGTASDGQRRSGAPPATTELRAAASTRERSSAGATVRPALPSVVSHGKHQPRRDKAPRAAVPDSSVVPGQDAAEWVLGARLLPASIRCRTLGLGSGGRSASRG